MKTMWTALSSVAGLALVTMTTAQAFACETDADCGAGHVCETFEYGGGRCDMDMPDCAPDDAECQLEHERQLEECEGEPMTDSYCTRAACETDADCGADMVCLEHTSSWCTGGGYVECDEEGNCESVEVEEECGTDVYRECGYRYEGVCAVDADCGAGFSCVSQEYCYCSAGGVGGGGSAGAPGWLPEEGEGVGGSVGLPSDDDEPRDEECVCELSGELRCELQEMPCNADSDCPASFVCNSYSTGACSEDLEGNVECTEETVSRCEPESWRGQSGPDGSGGSTGGVGEPGVDLGDGSDDNGEAGPGTGSGGSSSTDGGEAEGDDDDDAPPSHGHNPHWPGFPWHKGGHGFGCSVSAPSSTAASSPLGGAGLAGLLGLALFAARRRRDGR